MHTTQKVALMALSAALPLSVLSQQFPLPVAEVSSLHLGSGFVLSSQSTALEITQTNVSIWSTVPGKPFIAASGGDDIVLGSNGAFNITQVDVGACSGQNVTAVRPVPWDGALSSSAAEVSGYLLGCGDDTAPYTLTFWVPANLTDRVAFYLDVAASSDSASPLKKIYFSYASHANEDFYGLGAQASFASLKNSSIPIFSREQGAGRGDEPLTSLENASGTFAGGDKFTTYTAISSYVTTDGRVFYLSEKSTSYANFDFTEPDTVTVRYDSLSVDGAIARGSDMFDAVSKLTAATGRMPALPKWVDDGAILGIQGGQGKVNLIVANGLNNFSCPIAAVW